MCLRRWSMLFVVGNQMGIILKWEEGASHLYPFFLHGYANGRPWATTNPRYNISTLIFEPMFELSGLSQLRNEHHPPAVCSISHTPTCKLHWKHIPSPPSNGRTTTAVVPLDSYINWAQCFRKIWTLILHPSISTIISYTTTQRTIQRITATAAITSKLIVVACSTLSHPFNRVILHNFRVLNLCPRRIWQCEGTKTTSFFEPIHKK